MKHFSVWDCRGAPTLPLKFNLAPSNLVRGADITISFMSITTLHILHRFSHEKIEKRISCLAR